MNVVTIQTISRRAAILLEALPRTHPLPAASCPTRTRRLNVIITRLGRVVTAGLHVTDQISVSHSLLSRAQRALESR